MSRAGCGVCESVVGVLRTRASTRGLGAGVLKMAWGGRVWEIESVYTPIRIGVR